MGNVALLRRRYHTKGGKDVKRFMEKTTSGTLKGILAGGAMVLLLGAAMAQAGPAPDVKCEAGKNDTAGKYAACMAKAEKTFVVDGDQNNYDAAVGKCADKFGTSWQKLEDTADGKGWPWPSVGDKMPIQDFLDACQQSVAVAVRGGTLGPDPVTCATDLGTCNGSLATCNGNLGICSGSLGTCTGDFSTCDTNLSGTNADWEPATAI